ncbi:hypothetical protein TNIN_135661 [Trichonephila inaurata madagascariensis]|uniref:Uncharacterized protein n=1 Tax=Trichonephila inaurata madagascariensis TaxID=2747483 RepID=A0A8X7C057_9ARAC|nr:hypothetical protein TNIN_135661 [Trichonephila inaurata madagascariensis]
MEHPTAEYWCKSYQLQFKGFKKYLNHKYRNHDEPEPQPELDRDEGESQIYSNNFKTSCKIQIEKPSLQEHENNERGFNLSSDFYDCDKTQNSQDIFTESTTMHSCSKNITGNSNEPRRRYRSNPDSNKNERSLSLKYSQMDTSKLERKIQVNTSQPSISSECIQMEMCTQGMNEQIKRREFSELFSHNQMQLYTLELNEQCYGNKFSALSQHSQMQRFWLENHRQRNVNQPFTTTGIRQAEESFPQINTNPFFVSIGYSPIQSSTYEMNYHLITNQLSVSPENREFASQGMNAQSSANQRAVRDAYYNNSILRVSSPQQRRFNEIELNLQHYSKKNPTDLDSVGRSNYEESNHIDKTCLDQKEVNIYSLIENEIEEQNNTSASYSSLKKKETSMKCESYGSSFNDKIDLIRSLTSGCGTVENKLVGKLNPNRFLHSDTGKDLKDDYEFENGFNQKSHLVQTSAINTAEKMHKSQGVRSDDRRGQAVFGKIGSSHVCLSIPVLTIVGLTSRFEVGLHRV